MESNFLIFIPAFSVHTYPSAQGHGGHWSISFVSEGRGTPGQVIRTGNKNQEPLSLRHHVAQCTTTQTKIKADSSVNEYWTRHTRQRNRQVTRKIYEQTPLSIRTARKITMTFHFVLRSTRHDQKSTISHPRAEIKFFAASPASFARAEPPRSVGGRWCAQTHLRICWQGGVQLLRIVEVMCHLYRECINKSNILINAASYKNSCLS